MRKRRNLTRTLMTGVAGGAAGLLAMRAYWRGATALSGEDPRSKTRQDDEILEGMSMAGRQSREGESSTAKAGRMAHETITGDPPHSEEEKRKLSRAVHWGFGLALAGTYALLRGRVRPPDLLGGLAFGAGVWALADELMVPLLGLERGPTAYPVSQHAHRLGAHLAYGLATSTATQMVNRRLDGSRSRRTRAWNATRDYVTNRSRTGLRQARRQARKALERVRP